MNKITENYLSLLLIEEDIKSENLDASKMKTVVFDKMIKKMESKLDSHGIDINAIKKDAVYAAKNSYKDLQNMYEEKKDPKLASEKITGGLKRVFEKAVKNSSSILEKLPEAVWVALCIYIKILLITTFVAFILLLITKDYNAVTRAVMLVVSPILQEYGKVIFLNLGMPYLGSAILYGFGVSRLLFSLIFSGGPRGSLAKFTMVRAAMLLVNMITAHIHKKGKEMNKPHLAFVLAVLLNSAANLVMMLNADRLGYWIYQS